MKKILVITLLILLAIFQYQLWFSTDGINKIFSLKRVVDEQQIKNNLAQKHNDTVRSSIGALKKGNLAIEEHARLDLGMIKKGEVFYQVVK